MSKLDTERGVGGGYPSPKGGGPIEADLVAWAPQRTFHTIHRRKAVAPLKRVSVEVPQSVRTPIHRRKAVAPLKLAGSLLFVLLVSQLSIAERRWPYFIFRWPPVFALRRVLAMLIFVPL